MCLWTKKSWHSVHICLLICSPVSMKPSTIENFIFACMYTTISFMSTMDLVLEEIADLSLVLVVHFFLATANDFQLNVDLAILEIPPLNNDRCFTIAITDDNNIEGIEQFTISFEVDFTEPVSIQDRITGDPAEATIFIQDNDGNT